MGVIETKGEVMTISYGNTKAANLLGIPKNELRDIPLNAPSPYSSTISPILKGVIPHFESMVMVSPLLLYYCVAYFCEKESKKKNGEVEKELYVPSLDMYTFNHMTCISKNPAKDSSRYKTINNNNNMSLYNFFR